jgi:excisionase family DNA binding protein
MVVAIENYPSRGFRNAAHVNPKLFVAESIQMHTSDDDLLTVQDVAEILRVPTSWVYERTRRRSADRIPGFRIGKYWRFRLGDIKVWLEENRHVELTNA